MIDSKIVSFPRRQKQENELDWTIRIHPGFEDYVDVCWDDVYNTWSCYIKTSSIERAYTLKNQALTQWKMECILSKAERG